ncbi:MAG: hypothetical protein MI974_05390 [Chitinophagales bacterium]|nr:hypothetical protein [Chitinophagales bacterium]
MYRYPGAQPFLYDQGNVFFGRENDIENLYELVLLEQLVVLYSKSGIGKSSLLNAGILPLLDEKHDYQVFKVRFGAYTDGNNISPLSITNQTLASQALDTSVLDRMIPNESSLWYLLKSQQLSSSKNTFLICFDQFEELFTYPDQAIYQFKKELAELITIDIPARFRSFIEEQYEGGEKRLTEEELEMLHQPIEIKLIMAIRSDRLSLLNNLNDYLPNMLRVCYELEPLDREQAEEAIINPAFKKGDEFYTSSFDYEDAALDNILDFLTYQNRQKIESFQLQILCQSMEQKVMKEGLKQISLKEVEGLESIYENYYDNQIALLDTAEERKAARKLIEEDLILEEEERRLSIYEGQIYKSLGFTPGLLRKLVDVRLLRAEPSLQGGYTYELSHDTMVGSILKAKKQRLEAEQILNAQKERRKQEEAIKILKDKSDKERRRRNRALLVAGIAMFFALIATLTSIWAISTNQKLQNSSLLIKQQNQMLNQQLISLVEADYERLLAEGQQYQSKIQFDEAIQSYQSALAVIQDFPAIDQNGQKAKQAIEQCQLDAENAATFLSLIEEGDALLAKGEMYFRAGLNKYKEAQTLNFNETFNKSAKNKVDQTLFQLNKAFEKHRSRARLFLAEQNYEMACQSFKIAKRLKPNAPFLQEMPANCD